MVEDKELDELDEYLLNQQERNTSENILQNTSELSQMAVPAEANNSPSLSVVDESKSVEMFKTAAIGNITDKVKNGELDVDDGLKQFVNAVAIMNAVEDTNLKQELTKNAAKSLKHSSKSMNYKDEAKSLDRRTARNEAFYKAFRPILEFDLSHLVGKRRKKVITRDAITGKKTTTYEDVADVERKEYKDRSYGFMIMMLMIALLIVPYCVANIILAIFNAINAVFECFTKFGRIAFCLSTSIAAMSIIGLVVYVLLLIVQAAFGVQIFK